MEKKELDSNPANVLIRTIGLYYNTIYIYIVFEFRLFFICHIIFLQNKSKKPNYESNVEDTINKIKFLWWYDQQQKINVYISTILNVLYHYF